MLARIRDLNRLELAGETVRAALEALAAAAPGWLAGVTGASWQRVYGQRIDELRLPESQAAREELAVQYGRDGYWLLEQVHGPGAPGWLAEPPAVQALRRIWIQQYYRDGEEVIRREEREHGLPPGRDRIVSPYDLDARYSEKHGTGWPGYKGHFTETVSDPAGDDPGTGRPAVPNLVTDVQTTHAAVPDVAVTAPVHDSLEASGLLPGEHAVDSGYVSAGLLVSSRLRGVTLLGPLLAGTSAQARGGGYTADMFAVDWDRRQATCPQGAVSSKWAPLRQRRDGREAISVRFPAATCRACRPGTSAPRRNGPAGNCTCGPGNPRGRRRRPRRAGHPALERPVQGPRRRGGPHAPGHLRHRHPPRPLHRPRQDPPGAPRRRRHQRDPARRLVQRQAPGQDPDHPPSTHRPRARRMSSD